MNSIRRNARVAGLLYLALAVIAPFSLSYVPGVLREAGGVSATTVSAHATLLRFSAASELVYQLMEVFIALALFELFRRVRPRLALQMLVLGLLPIPIIFANQFPVFGAIAIATGEGMPASAALGARDAAVTLLHENHRLGLVIASIFWGLWLFPLGRLIIASSFLPDLLGWSVIVGGLGYVIRAIAILVLPPIVGEGAVQAFTAVAEVMMLGEVPVILGLLWLGFSRAPRDPLPELERAEA